MRVHETRMALKSKGEMNSDLFAPTETLSDAKPAIPPLSHVRVSGWGSIFVWYSKSDYAHTPEFEGARDIFPTP